MKEQKALHGTIPTVVKRCDFCGGIFLCSVKEHLSTRHPFIPLEAVRKTKFVEVIRVLGES